MRQGFSQKLTANLQPGEYDMTCGLLTNPKGKLIVKGEATADAAKGEALLSLSTAIADYKAYVVAETAQLVTGTKAFTDAVKSGDIEKRKPCMLRPANTTSALEPIAELFSDLDGSIDAREDDYEHKAADPKFTGFHRLEKRCLATIAPKIWATMPISSTPMWLICRPALMSWRSRHQKWLAAQPV